MNRSHIHDLQEFLHDKNMSCGEILKLADIADDIHRMERDAGVIYTEAELLTAWREAGETFVDSMQGNTADGYNYEGRHRETETEYQEELNRWEAMRPSVVRRKQIESIPMPPLELAKPPDIRMELRQALFNCAEWMQLVPRGKKGAPHETNRWEIHENALQALQRSRDCR